MSIKTTSSTITLVNRWEHFLARVGFRRNSHRVEPGLYSLGNPGPDSPVLVTANYKLSFNSLRSALSSTDAYILVLDTRGINVWCAAGKGTFGTDELVNRIEKSKLQQVVRHRKIILPQLGAPGVAAHEVKRRSGFKVEYGPVRADDLPEFLKTGTTTSLMRRIHFPLRDRLVLIPVEVAHFVLPILTILAVIWILKRGPLFEHILQNPGIVIVLLTGFILFPVLLPRIPTPDFSTKGFILGTVFALPFSLLQVLLYNPDMALWRQIIEIIVNLMIWVPPIAFLALNFTGSTTYTSRSGVRREIFRYIPIMAIILAAGILLDLVLKLF